ncbi:hypothetical protein Vi05172_g12884 [Venturia inaequalis]|nr:hypothetical protein Vi05172_g12884 [Venturia inaequalis]
MDRPTVSRRPKHEGTQDARVGILIQTNLEARNAIAARSSTNRQHRNTNERDARSTTARESPSTTTPQTQITTPPQSFNDKFPLYLAKLESLLRQIETSLSTIDQPPILTPHQTTSLKSIQHLLKANPNHDITPQIHSQNIPSIPIPTLQKIHRARLTLDSSLSLLLQLDAVLRGDKATEGESQGAQCSKGNGFLDWVKWGPETLADREAKVAQVEALVGRVVICDVQICDFLLAGGYGVEAWVLELVLDCVVGFVGGAGWKVVEGDAEQDGRGNSRRDPRDGRREGSRQITFPGDAHHDTSEGHLQSSSRSDNEEDNSDDDDDGPEEWEL